MINYLRSQDSIMDTVVLLKRPRYIIKALFAANSGNAKAHEEDWEIDGDKLIIEIATITKAETGTVIIYLDEFNNDVLFHEAILNKFKKTKERDHCLPNYGYRKALYLLVRLLKPSVMIETGSFDGLSSAVILQAMHLNSNGHLYTIDLPNPRLPGDIKAAPAWAVPDYLRSRFTLFTGTTNEYLQQAITTAGATIDMFYHDSWHTYRNMMFEYKMAWNALRPGGLLISEYLPTLNNAFRDFTKDKKSPPPNICLANAICYLQN